MLKDKNHAISLINSVVWNSYTPHEACGWPPGMLDHLRAIMHNMGIAIVESIYTEQELDNQIENVLLDKPEQI